MTIFPEALKNMLAGHTLECDRARRAIGFVIDGHATPAQTGAFLGALALRGATCDELVGFAQALRERCVTVKIQRKPLLEICSTGVPGARNISTAAAFIASGAGVAVANQVRRALFGCCGSAEILGVLGVKTDLPAQKAARCVEEAGVGFFLCSFFHPALEKLLPVRQELEVRTVLDMLEPMANPAGAQRQLLGVHATALVPMLARALKALGSDSAIVVSSRDGWDEFSLGAPSVVAQLREGRIEEYEVDAVALGLTKRLASASVGGDARAHAAAILSVLRGERTALFEVALLNAAAALVAAGRAGDFKEGMVLATESVDSCRALEALENVKRISQG